MNESAQQVRLKTNLDTSLLKLIAMVSMFIDHFGDALFPDKINFRICGRIAFPLFCYCMTVGLIYTRDIKRYLIRLAIFAVVSQPFWILCFNADDIMGNLFNLNIFFTLFMNLLTLWAFKEKKWWLVILDIITLSLINFDYGTEGIILMLIFYLCRNNPKLGATLYILSYLPYLFGRELGDYFTIALGQYPIDISLFAILAAPLIFLNTNSNLKINKWVCYAFYPAHLLVIYLIELVR